MKPRDHIIDLYIEIEDGKEKAGGKHTLICRCGWTYTTKARQPQLSDILMNQMHRHSREVGNPRMPNLL